MSAIALLNPYNSVDFVFGLDHSCCGNVKLIGIKNVRDIPNGFVKKLEETGLYKRHTLDRSALGGRAIDLNLINPITGRYMTGSSSGTAINVFLGINDIGIGVDGGGSVLAPAISLNLFGFISPLIASDMMSTNLKTSTDGIEFKPSLGYISYKFNDLIDIIKSTISISESGSVTKVMLSSKDESNYAFKTERIVFPDIFGERKPLIQFLKDTLPKCDLLLYFEGPVDLFGFGDSVFGHFDETTKKIQRAACKGLIRVINMANATAICIPQTALTTSIVLISESKIDKISKLLSIAEQFVIEEDTLINRYFRNSDLYLTEKFNSD